MTEVRAGSLAAVLALIGLSACQEPGQPGPTEHAGIQIDHAMAGVQRSVGEFSGQAGQGLDDAGRSVGAAAQQVGSRLHDWLDSRRHKFRPDPVVGAAGVASPWPTGPTASDSRPKASRGLPERRG